MAFIDTINVSDSLVNNFNQQDDATSDLQENLALSETVSLNTEYVFTDSVVQSDSALLDINLNKIDTINSTDVLIKDVDYTLVDTQNNTDQLALNVTTVLTDSVTTSDTLDVLIVIPVTLTDSITTSDTINTIDTEITFSDSVDTSTSMDRFFQQNHDNDSDFSDHVAQTDDTSYTLDYVISPDTITITDADILEIDKSVTDSVITTDAGGTTVLESYFAESYVTTQTYYIHLRGYSQQFLNFV